MKKQLTFIALLTAFFFTAQAQKGDKQIGIGAEVGLPIGNFSNGYGIGIGGTAKGMYGLNDNAHLTLTLGYTSFGIKEKSEYMSGSVGFIPILAGYRHSFGSLYAEPQLGLVVVRSSVKISGLEEFGFGGGSASTTNVGFALGGGYMLNENWDLGVRFQGVSATGGSMSYFALKVAYNFSL